MQKITYDFTDNDSIVLPDGPPFDGEPVLVKTKTGFVEAWWCKADPSSYDPTDVDGFCWVCYDDAFELELDDVTHWSPLPEIGGDNDPE